MTGKMWSVACVMALVLGLAGAPAVAGVVDVDVTTGMPGGEDSFVHSINTTTPSGDNEHLTVRWDTIVDENPRNTRHTYMRFDLGLNGIADPSRLVSAQLDLVVSLAQQALGKTIRVWGLYDSEDTWDEATITWENAPATPADAKADGDEIEGGEGVKGTLLGTFDSPADRSVGDVLSFSSAALLSFLKTETGVDKQVTLILTTNTDHGSNHHFASNDNLTYAPPTLKLEYDAPPIAEPAGLGLLGLALLGLRKRRS